jgi:hypothetical protein
VMNGGKSHRGIEGLVLERKALRVAATHSAAPAGRWARMIADGSTAVTSRSEGS